MVAVLKAGGAFVPLDPSHPAQRLRSLCESVNASLVLCSRKHEETVKGISHDVLVVDEAVLEESDTVASSNVAISPTNAAYVIFTSGSSGKPKVRTALLF
jgi:non-ribosomal peptide synthetase component F